MLSKDLVMAIHAERLRDAELDRVGRQAGRLRHSLTSLVRPAGGTPGPRVPVRQTPRP
jgi:hypothetical protein